MSIIALTTVSVHADSIRTSDGTSCTTNDKQWGEAYAEFSEANPATNFDRRSTEATVGVKIPLNKKSESLDCTKLLSLEERRLELELLEKEKQIELMQAQIELAKAQKNNSSEVTEQPQTQAPSLNLFN